MRFAYPWLIFILLVTLTCVAQQPAMDKIPDVVADKPAGSGTVSGHVYLSDTKGPARRATVRLQPAATFQIDVPNITGQQTADGGVIVEVQTHFDGSYFFGHVPAGNYYVIASSPGYVSPYLALALAGAQPPPRQPAASDSIASGAIEAVLKGIPRITVGSGQPATVDVILERGAAVCGNISYDDGAPAAGLSVEFLYRMLKDGKETWVDAPFLVLPGLGPNTSTTDDRGNYRISGLPPGKYIIATRFDLTEFVSYISSSVSGGSSSSSPNSNQWTNFKIYSGNTPRLKDAAVVSLSSGEEYLGEDLQFPLSKVHSITGHIVSAHDGHVVNSGQVYLYNNNDKSPAGTATISVDNAEFTFDFIYDGEYILTSPTSADVDYELLPQQPGSPSPPQYKSHFRHLYGAVSKPLHVDGDMDGVTIAAPEPTAQEAQTFKTALGEEERQEKSVLPDTKQR